MIYDVVKNTLSALDEQGTADHEDWETLVADRLESLEISYTNLRDPNRDLIDYSDQATQSAYVFRYVLGHAEFNYQFLKMARAKIGAPLFTDTVLTVTSLGGGPGSELLGLIKYLDEGNGEPNVTRIIYTVIDKEKNWQHIAKLVADMVTTKIDITITYQSFDVSSGAVPGNITLDQEDAVFMSFFISEVCALPKSAQVQSNIATLLKGLPSKSLLFYKDSNAFSFYSFFNKQVNTANCYEELLDITHNYKIPMPDFDGIMEDYVSDYDYRPKLSSNAVSKVLRRI